MYKNFVIAGKITKTRVWPLALGFWLLAMRYGYMPIANS